MENDEKMYSYCEEHHLKFNIICFICYMKKRREVKEDDEE